jgi:Cysteine-rich secretory protein family
MIDHLLGRTTVMIAALGAAAVVAMPTAHADNKRLNDGVVANVYTVAHQAGCTNDIKINPQLQLAAQWHAQDVLNNRNLDADIGSDGSTVQERANAAGFRGKVAETVAINPAVAISGIELINQWYYNPAYFAIMSNCANTAIGVWSENSLDRTVVVAVYGQPDQPVPNRPLGPEVGLPSPVVLQENVPLDPSPDYDASDEIEYGLDWFPWILRGVYPPPAYPPN